MQILEDGAFSEFLRFSKIFMEVYHILDDFLILEIEVYSFEVKFFDLFDRLLVVEACLQQPVVL